MNNKKYETTLFTYIDNVDPAMIIDIAKES